MTRKRLMARAETFAGLIAVAASVAVAVWMHRTDRFYSCMTAPCPALDIGYPVADRLAVVAAGFLAAGLIIAMGAFARRHFADHRTGG